MPSLDEAKAAFKAWKSTQLYIGETDLLERASITACGRLCLHRKRINISTVLAGQKLGVKEVDESIWLVSLVAGREQ
jgi:hypothetical protein